MSLLKKFSAACALAFISCMCPAQSTLSLREILQRVDSRAPSLLADSSLIRVRRLQEDATAYNWLPNLRLNIQADLGTNNNVPGGYFSYGIVPGNSRVRAQGNSSTILTDLGIASFDWEVCNFGAYGAQRRVAASDVQVEMAHYAQSRYGLESYAIEYYLQLIRLQDQLRIQSLNITRNEDMLRSVSALARNGIRPGVDTSVAGAELSRARLNYLELESALDDVRLQLAALSGYDAAAIKVDSASLNKLLNASPLLMPADTGSHPLVQYYQAEVQNSMARERLVRKSYNPKISVEAAAWGRGSSVSGADEFRPLPTGFGFERSNYLTGVGVTYNLFDLKREQMQLRIQNATTEYQQRRLDAAHATLGLNLSAANEELKIARLRLVEIPRQLAAAEAAYRQKLSLYRNGLTDVLELNIALNVLYRAETDAATAKYQYGLALFHQAIAANSVYALLQLL
jgi:adhesin transport system outer membrane protein